MTCIASEGGVYHRKWQATYRLAFLGSMTVLDPDLSSFDIVSSFRVARGRRARVEWGRSNPDSAHED